MTVKRLLTKDGDAYIIMIMYREAKKHPHDGQWRRFDGTIRYKDREYHITADFVLRDAFFTYKNLEVTALDRTLITLN